MTASPGPVAVTFPFASTVATLVFVDLTFISPIASLPVIVTCAVFPFSRLTDDLLVLNDIAYALFPLKINIRPIITNNIFIYLFKIASAAIKRSFVLKSRSFV